MSGEGTLTQRLRGLRVGWSTVGGAKYTGTIREVDSNVLHVQCDDGEERAVEMSGVYLLESWEATR